jgi:hypothetical protein
MKYFRLRCISLVTTSSAPRLQGRLDPGEVAAYTPPGLVQELDQLEDDRAVPGEIHHLPDLPLVLPQDDEVHLDGEEPRSEGGVDPIQDPPVVRLRPSGDPREDGGAEGVEADVHPG